MHRSAPRWGFISLFGGLLWPGTRIPDELRPRRSQQASTDKVQIGQRTGDKEPVGVLFETPVADLGEMKDAFDDAKDVLDAAADLGLDTVTSALDLVYDALVPIAAAGEVLRLRGVLPEDIGLTLVGRVAPDFGFLAMKEIRQDRGVVDIGGGGHDRMDDLGFAVDPDMGLYPLQGVHPKKPLVALPGLVPIGITFLLLVLGR